MCGITGICHLTEPRPVSLDELKRMTGALMHRGPDGSGIYIDDWVGLGHTRLSIIDLSGGFQPIHNEDKTLWIVYNGEIFNYRELRQELAHRGHRFYTASDTEVILHLYEERGPACLDSLNGQFALAIWNSKQNELFLARDRVGILPLHYTVNKGRLLFSSEIKSIFMAEGVERKVDPIAMDQIFTFWTTLPGRTFFRDVQELLPGHYLLASRGKITVRKYWELSFASRDEQLNWPLEEICDNLKNLILDAVRIRLRADVPVGCYLSGGLDSSAITTVVKKNFNNRLRTFGIGFEEEDFDEAAYQQAMVAYLETEHTAMQATNEKIGKYFSDVLWHCEKPLLRTAPVPLFLLSQTVTENGFKVVLTGEGADEIFGGYNIFREAKIRRFWGARPESRKRPLLIARLYPYIFKSNPHSKNILQSFFGNGREQMDDPLYSHLIRWRNTAKIKTFFSPQLREEIGAYSCLEDVRSMLPEAYKTWDGTAQAQYLESVIFLGTYLLSSQGDRVAMAHGVEVRPPFLDHRIIEFMGRIKSKWKIRGLNEKYALKKTFQGMVPEQIIRRPKHPYRAPIRESLLFGMSEERLRVLSDNAFLQSGLFDLSKIKILFKKLNHAAQAGEVESMALAGILSSQIINEQFIGRFPSDSIQPVRPDLIIDRRSGTHAGERLDYKNISPQRH